jgi:N-acetyl-anhydromuramyl-L-alanine amidase AmpD
MRLILKKIKPTLQCLALSLIWGVFIFSIPIKAYAVQYHELDIIKIPAKYFRPLPENAKFKALIFHCLGLSLEDALSILSGTANLEVSAHFFIPQLTAEELKQLAPQFFNDDTLQDIRFWDQVPVIELVSPHNSLVAFHAGISSWSNLNEVGTSSLNNYSIGIEFHTPGYANDDGADPANWYHFENLTEGQKRTGILLAHYLLEEFSIDPSLCLGHSDVSAYRENLGFGKTDPGVLFYWKELAEVGVGFDIWKAPKEDLRDYWQSLSSEDQIGSVQEELARIGYRIEVTRKIDRLTRYTILAYRLHFMPEFWQSTQSSEMFIQLKKRAKSLSKKIEADYDSPDAAVLKEELQQVLKEANELVEASLDRNALVDEMLFSYLKATPRMEYLGASNKLP